MGGIVCFVIILEFILLVVICNRSRRGIEFGVGSFASASFLVVIDETLTKRAFVLLILVIGVMSKVIVDGGSFGQISEELTATAIQLNITSSSGSGSATSSSRPCAS